MTLCGTIIDTTTPVNTKIAFSFYDLGMAYEKRNRFDLAIENYKKSLDYDEDLYFVKNKLQELINLLKRNDRIQQSINKFQSFTENFNAIYW